MGYLIYVLPFIYLGFGFFFFTRLVDQMGRTMATAVTLMLVALAGVVTWQ